MIFRNKFRFMNFTVFIWSLVIIMEVILDDIRWYLEVLFLNLKGIVLDKKWNSNNKIFIFINIYVFYNREIGERICIDFLVNFLIYNCIYNKN